VKGRARIACEEGVGLWCKDARGVRGMGSAIESDRLHTLGISDDTMARASSESSHATAQAPAELLHSHLLILPVHAGKPD
jgi:hypothetical protein